MDINLERYHKAIGVEGRKRETFLNKWYLWGWNKFRNIYKEEFDQHQLLSSCYYRNEIDKGIDGLDIVASEDFRSFDKKLHPMYRHKIMYYLLVKIPSNIHSWLCCGWKLKYVPSDGICKAYWTWFDRYHMMTKLCRYGSPMWPEYKFTWWDKLRFKWITGYKYEEEK